MTTSCCQASLVDTGNLVAWLPHYLIINLSSTLDESCQACLGDTGFHLIAQLPDYQLIFNLGGSCQASNQIEDDHLIMVILTDFRVS